MEFVSTNMKVAWQWAQRIAPFLVLEALLPGGTLLALLLFLYPRRALNAPLGEIRGVARFDSEYDGS